MRANQIQHCRFQKKALNLLKVNDKSKRFNAVLVTLLPLIYCSSACNKDFQRGISS